VSDPFVAEIRMFGFNFAPTGWATCDGQILPLSQNTALFSLLGTMYGGDGKSNFGLPNLQGSAPMHLGQGPGLSERFEGEQGGEPTVTLISTEVPPHTHSLNATNQPGNKPNPGTNTIARYADAYNPPPVNNPVQTAPTMLSPQGGDLPHNNMMPTLTVIFCIALQGIFPPRS
jgi:microcystin-dependent protein